MSASIFLFGILPLLIFVIIDSFAGLRSGVVAALIFAIAETGYTLWEYGTIDALTIGSLVLVLVFGLFSYKYNNPIYIKLQPVFIGVIFGLVLVIMQLAGKPLLPMMIDKYQMMLPEEIRAKLTDGALRHTITRLSGILGVGFLIHASLVAYAAFRMNKWWWLLMRGIGVYIMMGVCVVVASIDPS